MATACALVEAGCGRIGFASLASQTGDGGLTTGDGRRSNGGVVVDSLPAPRDGFAGMWELVDRNASISDAGSNKLGVGIGDAADGDLIVVAVYLCNGGMVTGITDNAPGGTSSYAAIPAAKTSNPSDEDYLELWYAAHADTGAGAIIVEASAETITAIVAWDFAVRGTAQLDTAAAASSQPATTTPVSPAIKTATAGELVIATMVPAADVVDIHAGNPFVDDETPFSAGYAHLADTSAPTGTYQAEWDTDADATYCANAAAFTIGP